MRLLHFAFTLSFVSLALAWTTYDVPHLGGGLDDTPALAKAFAENPSLAKDATITFKKGITYNFLTPIKFPFLQNVIVSVQGNLTCANDIKTTQAIVGSGFPVAWVSFSGGGSNVTLIGSRHKNWGWINSNGQEWWDAGVTTSRPRGLSFDGISGGEVKLVKMSQFPAWAMCISGNDIHVYGNTIKAISSSKHTTTNTDAFDVQGTNILIEKNVVINGDDCLSINNPGINIHFLNNYCNGGHGLSVAALAGGGNVVFQDIVIENVVVANSRYGARFKSWANDRGTAKNIIWKNITMKNVVYPIYVTQNYLDNHDSYTPSGTATGSVYIDTLIFQDFRGTVDDVSHGSTAIITLDLYKGDATGILAKNIQMKALSGKPVSVVCDPSTISGDVGFKCSDGVFKPTAAGK